MLDVECLGRLAYLICRDALEDVQQIELWKRYGVKLEFVSCYSSSLSFFENRLKYFSESYKGLSVLANCCAPRIGAGDKEIGFVSLPVTAYHDSHRTKGKKYSYTINKDCENGCKFRGCQHIFTLTPNKLYTGKNHIGIQLEVEKVFFE